MVPPPFPPSPFYRVSVKALVFDDRGRLLIGRSGDLGWEIPGGGWEHGEPLIECLQRELAEELGVAAASIDETRAVAGASPGPHYHRVKLAVPVTLESTVFTLGDGMIETRWATEDEFAALIAGGVDEALLERRALLWELATGA